MGSEYQTLSSAESCRTLSSETSECFICRDVAHRASDPLRNFCDCKNLLSHHVCLSTWIQKYQVQRRSPWRSVSSQGQTWLVLLSALVLLFLVPYAVYCLMTAFTNPPPSITFKVAAASFGLLTEILILKCVSSFLSSRYRQAAQSSFTVRARGSDQDRRRGGRWEGSEASAGSGQPSSAASPSQVDGRKVDMLKSGCLSLY
ncbi:uncharacterized protein LOC117490973 isoform X2 [Trematomus bernacchii]|uniref:uncharacterized protein LOC117490973 isoform X2 n=1 Tax=Trematomus bernacchii TaxID=40690 RepID=UPI00146C5EAD|nr:uncharacterized protein LOC117490973 isoform X2 [Trematomus bernacchii]